MTTDLGYLPRLQSREEFVDYLEGFVPNTEAELEEVKPARKLIKTYMLETASRNHKTPELGSLFPKNVQLHRLDDTLYRVEDANHNGEVVGLLEALDDRHPVIHTTMKADESNKWTRKMVDNNPWLDRLWLSSPILFELWNHVQHTTPSDRYVRLGFDHEAHYEALDSGESFFDSEDTIYEEDDGVQGLTERRKSKVTITERLLILKRKLGEFIDLYDPLHSLVQLQVPSGGRGGHLFYHDGHVTNRSDSFLEHRAALRLVLKLYRNITEHAENQLWFDVTKTDTDAYYMCGSPLTIQFSNPLTSATFDRFVDLGLRRRTSRFRIGGYITRHGPTKIHMAAIDRHLWQPLLLELTSKQLLVVLPKGTCGNTIHRLVTNVQRSLDPKVDVWLGSESYESAVAASMKAVFAIWN